jgi:thymidine kinase
MGKLYFKYGAMGSSKTAEALMCKFNYEQKGFKVFLFKPMADNRTIVNGKAVVHSRIGIESPAIEFEKTDNFFDYCSRYDILQDRRVVIVDEAQFLTKAQVNQLKEISLKIPVLCYGLLTNFKTELFEVSKRLVEIADSLHEIKSVCRCGRKATVNARIVNGKIATTGEEIMIGADESYEGMCYTCYCQKLVE